MQTFDKIHRMNIYIGHPKGINYIDDLYIPIKELPSTHNFILPHENNKNSQNDRSFYESLDLFIAEVSIAATGLGIELGWAFDSNVPIICIYKKGSKISGSLKSVTDRFYEYSDNDDLKTLISEIIKD